MTTRFVIALLCACVLSVVLEPFIVRSSGANLTHSPADTTKPIRPLMVELAQDMDRIATGLWHEDYELIEEGARSIAQHPKIPPRQIEKIKKALGPKFEGFVSVDRSVHQTATKLVKAAQARDWSKVLDTHERLKRGCTSCHATYRKDLRPVLNP